MIECVCQLPPFDYRDYEREDLGSDSMNADIYIDTCKNCGTRWVVYLIEWPHFSKSTRWYRAPVRDDEILALCTKNAKDYIERQEWCFAGGDFYRERGIHKKTKPITIV